MGHGSIDPFAKFNAVKRLIARQEQAERINNLCVKSYLEILGYSCVVSARGYSIFPAVFPQEGSLYVDYDINKFRIANGPHIGGVLDLAVKLFRVSKNTILKDIVAYRIDQLIAKSGNRMGSIPIDW